MPTYTKLAHVVQTKNGVTITQMALESQIDISLKSTKKHPWNVCYSVAVCKSGKMSKENDLNS